MVSSGEWPKSSKRLARHPIDFSLPEGAESILQTSSEYLREEARLSPTQVEFDRFCAQLTTLKHDVARAEAQLQRMLEKIESR